MTIAQRIHKIINEKAPRYTHEDEYQSGGLVKAGFVYNGDKYRIHKLLWVGDVVETDPKSYDPTETYVFSDGSKLMVLNQLQRAFSMFSVVIGDCDCD